MVDTSMLLTLLLSPKNHFCSPKVFPIENSYPFGLNSITIVFPHTCNSVHTQTYSTCSTYVVRTVHAVHMLYVQYTQRTYLCSVIGCSARRSEAPSVAHQYCNPIVQWCTYTYSKHCYNKFLAKTKFKSISVQYTVIEH